MMNLGDDVKPEFSLTPDAPDFAKEIIAKKSAVTSMPLDMDYQFVPKNPYTMNGNELRTSSDPNVKGLPQSSPFTSTVKAEFENLSTPYHAAHAAYEHFNQVNPLDDPRSADWTSKSDVSKFVNIRPQNLQYIFDATGPKDQEYRLQRVMHDQWVEDTLANGSWSAKIIGGASGLLLDPTNLIPIVGWAKYGKLGYSFLKNAARAAPGVTAYSAISAGAEQADKVNGNLHEFMTDTFVRSVFGSALFGLGGVLATSAEKLNLWNTRNLAKSHFDGVDYKLKMDDEGKITGLIAHDSEGNLSAAQVSIAQDLANSTFAKSGLFKIPSAIANAPYVKPTLEALGTIPGVKPAAAAIGNAAYHFHKYFGSEIPLLLSSPFEGVRGFIDRADDHGIITKGLQEGEVAPRRFNSMMQQTFANLRSLQTQMNALHLERNGFKTDNRILGGVSNAGLYLKDKTLNVLDKDLQKTEYVPREQFDDEVEQVLRTEQSSDHAAVNDAAKLMRKQMDDTYRAYRRAYNLPEDWLPPKTAEAYLMRVYNTPYMNVNLESWTKVISKWLRDADQLIERHLSPIKIIDEKIAKTKSKEELMALKARKKAMQESIQNELRNNPELQLHVEDWNALSADEAKQIKKLTTKLDAAKKQVDDQTKLVSRLKKQKNKDEKSNLTEEESKLAISQKEYDDESVSLQEEMASGRIDQRLFYKVKDSYRYEFKNPEDRLKFRETYKEQAARDFITDEEGIHKYRIAHAKAYYDTIMHQTPEETINQVMGRFTGNKSENPIKQRTLLIPDEILYKNGFMSKDLMAKVSNYTNYLSRRTHLKTAFNEVTHGGGIEPIIEDVNASFNKMHSSLNTNKSNLQDKLESAESNKDKKNITDQIKAVDKEIVKLRKRFDADIKSMNHVYEKMMGMKQYSRGVEQARSIIMSLTAMGNLQFVPFTQVNDLGAIALQHGVWPLVRDGMYPMIQSLFRMLKTKDSEAFRNTAPSIHLALQDVDRGYADRNWGMQTNPYLNLGRTVNFFEKLAHKSSNFTLTNYIDNYLQRLSSATIQAELMRILHAFKAGTISKRDSLYIRKYGIDPKIWADRMITAFEKDGGGKTTLGGYQSLHYKWQDLEAANEFGDAIFRGVKDTQIQAGLADSPFWTDNPLGSIIKGFAGWGYASVNRYLIPTMQQPDAERLLGILCMLGTGALIDPVRRMARGDDPYPDNITPKQEMWSAFNNSGIFSYTANVLSNANLLSGDRLLGDLKNDKYKDRTRAGLLGPAWGQGNRMLDVISAAASGEWNKSDMKKAARMLPFVSASWNFWLTNKVIDGLNIPANRSQAHALKESNS